MKVLATESIYSDGQWLTIFRIIFLLRTLLHWRQGIEHGPFCMPTRLSLINKVLLLQTLRGTGKSFHLSEKSKWSTGERQRLSFSVGSAASTACN